MSSIINFVNHNYWNHRAEGYSEVNQEELSGVQREKWSRFLDHELQRHFSDRTRSEIEVLDIGAGPGFLSIIMTDLGYHVTSADFSEEMLKESRKNAGDLAEKICYRQENAQELSFSDQQFDVVLSRNLTWNLPDPEKAYSEWNRVLRTDGLLFVFDANWYAYLFDAEKRDGYERDREAVAQEGFDDYNIGENFDRMERIAEGLPLSNIKRPSWDRDLLEKTGQFIVETTEDIGERVYSKKELVNYRSTPMFMVRAYKAPCLQKKAGMKYA